MSCLIVVFGWSNKRVTLLPLVFLLYFAQVQGFLLGAIFNGKYKLPVGVALTDGAEYDYIVVGAGAAGSAAASRLALAGFQVLLLEAGGDPDPISKVPMAAMGLLGSPMDWQYKTIPNNVSCLSSQGKQCRFSRGKCLGGSTSINYMLYTRGNRRDFDDFNVTGWSWKELKPYFLRYEGLQVLNQLPTASVRYHNTTGNMRLEFFDNPQNPWQARIVEGLESLNFPLNRDVNGESQIGVSKVVGYVYKGERMSAARGYLGLAAVRRRLRVAKHAFCTGVILDEHNAARGVTAVQAPVNASVRLYARREVVLSAGAVGTPHILLASGVGPPEHLRALGVPVRVPLPVGDDMRDHVLPLLAVRVGRGAGAGAAADLRALAALAARGLQLAQFLATRDGPLASNGLTDVVAFYNADCYDPARRRLHNDSAACELPTVQMIYAYVDRNLLPLVKPLVRQAIGFEDDVIEQLSDANERHALIVVSAILLRPYSRGTVRLASADPLVPPAIFANYLGDSRDVDQMVAAIGVVEQLVATDAFRRHNASIVHLKLAGCAGLAAGGAEYWACYARHMTHSVYHAVGTCAVGRVLDAALRVGGVGGAGGAARLRVADASAVPAAALPRGNTAALALALGERVADLLLDTAAEQQSQH